MLSTTGSCAVFLRKLYAQTALLRFVAPPVWVAEYCDERVTGLCVYARAHILGTARSIVSMCCLWPWLGPRTCSGGVAMRYVGLLPVLQMTSYLHIICHYRCMTIPLQRVTLLRRRAQTNAPAMSYCLESKSTRRHAPRPDESVQGAPAAGGEACNAPYCLSWVCCK